MKDTLMESLLDEVKPPKQNYDKVEEIHIDKFITNVLPNISSMEVMPENSHINNFMSLIAPVNEDAPNILKWNNNFTWSYNGNITDSMKERVKFAGGNVTGVLRFSIQWNEERQDTANDLDAHCYTPFNHIYFSNRQDGRTGVLDVDIQVPGTKTAVENITWKTKSKMQDGTYAFFVDNFSGKNTKGFRAEIEFDGKIYSYDYNKPVTSDVIVAEVTLKNGEFTIKHSLPESNVQKEVYNVKTNQFQKVSMLTISPNYWDNQQIGNKHYFFILDKCLNDEAPRGFYNEFLDNTLDKHRKVFEILGNKTKCELSDKQLSGLGFSTTKRNSLICKVKGTFNRTLKIKF